MALFPDAHPKEWRMQCYSAPQSGYVNVQCGVLGSETWGQTPRQIVRRVEGHLICRCIRQVMVETPKD